MSSIAVALTAALAVVAVYALWRALPTWRALRGKRLVECPETHTAVAVDVDARRAAMGRLLGEKGFELRTCTRWPERAGCGQECLGQIEQSPHDCLVRSIVERWYAEGTCVFCEKPIGPIHWGGHDPALLTPDQQHTIQWHQVKPEQLPQVLSTHWPVCWKCHMVESVRHKHPDLVTDRPVH